MALVAIEATFHVLARPQRLLRNNFLNLTFNQEDSVQRLIAYNKIIKFVDADPDIIQVGDSSGLHGVQPPIVMSHIPSWRYLNLSVATNLGYNGYYNMAKLQLERSPHAKYLVLYTSLIGGVPRHILWDSDQKLMGPLINDEFLSPLNRLFQLPTLAARQPVTDYIYSLGHRFKREDAPMSTNRGYLAFQSIFDASDGWVRETDVEGDVPSNIYKAILPNTDIAKADSRLIRVGLSNLPTVTDESFFNWLTLSQVSYFDHIYGKFAELARENNVQLVLIFNPFPKSSLRPEFNDFLRWKEIRTALERVHKRHPDVIITGFDFWPDDRFSVFSHIATTSSDENSQRVGRIMRKIIRDQTPVARMHRSQDDSRSAEAVIDFSGPHPGYGWTDNKGTTNGFPLRYVGPRDTAWMFASVQPGRPYRIKALYRTENGGKVGSIAMHVNRVPMKKISSGRNGDTFYTEWAVPAKTVDNFRGWLTLKFDLIGLKRPDDATRPVVSFNRLTIIPE